LSNYLAIAAVTATLEKLLQSGINQDLSSVPTVVTITAQPPDTIINENPPQDGLNIFLYHIEPNTGYRNADLPIRNSAGNLVNRPRLGINLHYMLTALAANDDDLRAHEILASAIRILHETPVLTREMVLSALATPPNTNPELSGSDLAYQIELVKITPYGLTLEEISKVWASFFQINYRVSVTYVATVVLLDSELVPSQSFPVLFPAQITTLQFLQPTITQIQPAIVPYSPGATVSILGQNFSVAPGTPNILIGGLSVVPSSVTNTQILFGLPPASTASLSGLTAGTNNVQIVQVQNLETPNCTVSSPLPPGITLPPPSAHDIFSSNSFPVVIAPVITTPPPISVNLQSWLTLGVQPSVAEGQQVSFLIGSVELPWDPANQPNGSPPLEYPLTELTVQIPLQLEDESSTFPFPTGLMPLRVRIDGADSPLTYTPPPVTTPPTPPMTPYINVLS
jgi:hypothetical protein